MALRHHMSRTAIELIKRFEGYRRKAAQLPDGRWTIGYGHTKTARKGAEVSEADAEALLIYDLLGVADAVREQVHAPLNRNQSDALCAFAFNVGVENFARSGVLKRLNEGSPILAACAMELWRKADVGGETIVVDALVRRRAAEKALFLTPDGEAWPTAPSHLLQPLLDSDAREVVPSQTPVEVAARETDEAVVAERIGKPVPPPAVPEEDEGPVRAAAEAITARLSTIFQEEPVAAAVAPPAEAPPDPTPQPPPFVLEPPEFDDAEADEQELDSEPEIESTPGPDLFTPPEEDAEAEERLAEPEAAEELEEASPAEGPAWPGPARDPEERRIIDDAVPYDFDDEPIAPPSQPETPQGGAATLVALAILGLVFFGGGVFWATNARPAPERAWIEPTMVGWLAGVTGALFFAVAVYLLLLRLGRSQERAAREGR
jgi:lysozyme